jgi:hypothetical protein
MKTISSSSTSLQNKASKISSSFNAIESTKNYYA